ncbi:hypothetical protein BaRGS_00018580 [Batillaria attramentaria]|uniref:Uncharacterized protein n=1 Tax=Batillaria attramentaria TaxID=370345 RepID=A0ABD0KST7_9CAEN
MIIVLLDKTDNRYSFSGGVSTAVSRAGSWRERKRVVRAKAAKSPDVKLSCGWAGAGAVKMNCFRCAGAGRTPRDTTIQIDEPKTQENKEPAEGANGDLTAEQKTIIQSTWKDFKRGDYVKDAAHIYIE